MIEEAIWFIIDLFESDVHRVTAISDTYIVTLYSSKSGWSSIYSLSTNGIEII